MSFANYKNTNNADSRLISSISASATMILIKDWDQNIFPNEFPFLLTLEHEDINWNVTTREIIKVTWMNQNSLIVQRWAWKCVQDDTATNRIQDNVPHSFSAWDKISLYFTSEQVADIQEELKWKLSVEEYRDWTYVYWASTSEWDDYRIDLRFPPATYEIWQVYRFLANVWNTWSASLNVNWLWERTIKKNHDEDLQTWDIEEWQIVEVAFDWEFFQMNSQTATVVDLTNIQNTSVSMIAWNSFKEWEAVWYLYEADIEADNRQNIWWYANEKVRIPFTATNWTVDLYTRIRYIEWKEWTDITLQIQKDSWWQPDWTDVANINIKNSIKWPWITNTWAPSYWPFSPYTSNRYKQIMWIIYKNWSVWSYMYYWYWSNERQFVRSYNDKSEWIWVNTFKVNYWINDASYFIDRVQYIDPQEKYIFFQENWVARRWIPWTKWFIDWRKEKVFSWTYTNFRLAEEWNLFCQVEDWQLAIYTLEVPYDLDTKVFYKKINIPYIWNIVKANHRNYVFCYTWNHETKAYIFNEDFSEKIKEQSIWTGWYEYNADFKNWIYAVDRNWYVIGWWKYYMRTQSYGSYNNFLWYSPDDDIGWLNHRILSNLSVEQGWKYRAIISNWSWTIEDVAQIWLTDKYDWLSIEHFSQWIRSENINKVVLTWKWTWSLFVWKRWKEFVWISSWDYNVLDTAKITNNWIARIQWITKWVKYAYNNWELSTDWDFKIWTAISDTLLNIRYIDETAPVSFTDIIKRPNNVATTSTSFILIDSYTCTKSWSYLFERNQRSERNWYWTFMSLFVNWTQIIEKNHTSNSWQNYSFPFSLKEWDLLELKYRSNWDNYNCYINDMKLFWPKWTWTIDWVFDGRFIF